MRLIDGGLLSSILEKSMLCMQKRNDGMDPLFAEFFGFIKRLVNSMPTVDIATSEHMPQKAEGWISIKDRLPEDEEQYLTFDGYDIEILLFDIHQKHFKIFDYNGCPYIRKYITHWMPLPENPEE